MIAATPGIHINSRGYPPQRGLENDQAWKIKLTVTVSPRKRSGCNASLHPILNRDR
jgi:hypothetical protein